MKLHLRGRTARFIARPSTIVFDYEIVPGTNSVTVINTSTASVSITAWAWSLKKAGIEVATSSDESPTFTSLAADDDYTFDVSATLANGKVRAAPTSGEFGVDPGALAMPTISAGTPSGLTIPLTLGGEVEPDKVEDRAIFWTDDGSDPDTSSNVVVVENAILSYDFVAAGAGTYKFRLQDRAIAGLATDSALSSATSQTIAGGGGVAPSAPTLDSVDAINERRIDLAWTIGADIGSGNHKIFRVASGDTAFVPDDTPVTGNLLEAELPAATNSYTDSTVSPETQYSYKVTGVNAAGSATSNGASATTPAQGEWPDNRPVGMTTIFSLDGSTKLWGGNYTSKWLNDANVSVVTDAASRHGSAVEKRYFLGDSSGWNGQQTFPNFPNGVGKFRRIYICMVVAWSPNYDFHQGNQKITMFGPKDGGDLTWSAFYPGMTSGGRFYFRAQVGGSSANGLGIYKPVDTSISLLSGGAYHTIELDFLAQSAPGVADGSLRCWLDGNEVLTWNKEGNPNFRESGAISLINTRAWYGTDISGSDLRIGGCQNFEYWGGNTKNGVPVKTVNDYVRISHFEYAGSQS